MFKYALPFHYSNWDFFFPQGGSYRALLAYEKEVELLRKEKASRRLPDKVQ